MIVIEREVFTPDLAAEMLPLARKSWTECTLIKGEACAFHGERDFLINPDFEAYLKLESEGTFVFLTLRDEGVLRGYVEGFTYPTIHHKGILGGIGDSMYVDPEYRDQGMKMVERFEDEMKAKGVQIIGWPVPKNGYVYKWLRKREFVIDDVVMEKRINKCA